MSLDKEWTSTPEYETNGDRRIKKLPAISRRLVAKKIECCLGIFAQYNIETSPPIMKQDEYYYCSKNHLSGEEQAIEAIVTNIMPQINAIEVLQLQGADYNNSAFTLSKTFFEAFQKHGVDLSCLRVLKVEYCVLNLSEEEMFHFLSNCKLEEFYHSQSGGRNKRHQGEPVNYLSDRVLAKISKSVEIISYVHSFCRELTDVTLEQWKTSPPTNTGLNECHTSFTLKGIWELIQRAKKESLPVKWSFGYIFSSEENQTTLMQMQKEGGITWSWWTEGHYRLMIDVLTKQKLQHYIDFHMITH